MNTEFRRQLADHSQLLVHYAWQLMGVLAQPPQSQDPMALGSIAGHATVALQALRAVMAATPELAAHSGTIQRFDTALCDWRRSVTEDSPLVARYQTALLQQAAQVVTLGLDVEAAARESAPMPVTRDARGGRATAARP